MRDSPTAERAPAPRRLLRVDAIRRLETDRSRGLPDGALMARAGLAVAETAARALRRMPPDTGVAVLAGPGNNGGDALVAADLLARRGYRVDVYALDALLDRPPAAADAARAWHRWRPRALQPLAALHEALREALRESRRPPAPPADRLPLLVDGLFGIGLRRPLDAALGPLLDAVADARGHGAQVVAIDVPSGLDADTGSPVGGGRCLGADLTVTMLGDKPGLHTGFGRQAAGRVVVALLDVPSAAPRDTPPDALRDDGTDLVLLDAAAVAPLRPARDVDSHKGRHGDLLVVGGRLGMDGAARLAARGALAAGAGKVTIAASPVAAATGVASTPGAADTARPETMRIDLPAHGDWPSRFDVVVIGCGLGTDATARRLVRRALALARPLVVDADALTLIGADPALQALLAGRRAASVLTPHPLEAARLLDSTTAAVQRDRIGAARALAARYGAIAVLKGAGTVVADPRGNCAINDSGGPILATGGTGDVLAGIVGALAAILSAPAAACLGVWVHGAAGDRIARRRGELGMPAAALADELPRVFADLARGSR